MEKSKILVCCHKKAEVYSDDIYTPIHVGKALHPNLNLGFMTDNIGENISEKNDSFCELTAQYWAWKNLRCKYIGLCHYRRYFSETFDKDSLDEILLILILFWLVLFMLESLFSLFGRKVWLMRTFIFFISI